MWIVFWPFPLLSVLKLETIRPRNAGQKFFHALDFTQVGKQLGLPL